MPKKYGFKEKDHVVAHVVDQLLTGKLRTGDRLHRKDVAEELGLSRAPVQEAVMQLEHDGVLSTRYHRGVFVERFDEQVLREHHELYGALTGIVSARAATDPATGLLPALDRRLGELRSAAGTPAFQGHALQFRQHILDQHAGPRLRAAIRGAQIFMPRPDWRTYLDGHRDLLPYYESETVAIAGRDPDAARAACRHRSDVAGTLVVNELLRRRILGPGAAIDDAAAQS